MSASRRCLQTCYRSLTRPQLASRKIANQRLLAVRSYGHAALQEQPLEAVQSTSGAARQYQEEGQRSYTRRHDDTRSSREERPPQYSQHLADHLNQLFSPLKFPPELAHRILTHGSHVGARQGHNAGLSFMGRRVLESYLFLFLNASANLKPSHDLDEIASHTLNTNVLGEFVGSKWGYGNVLQWKPAVSQRELEAQTDTDKAWKRIGFYKVQGDAVAATMGAVFSQHGAAVAHRLFHTRVLPRLLVPGGLPNAFHGEAVALFKRMGGKNANLLTGGELRPPHRSQKPSSDH
ncbi:hypothetical protein FA15DRAFT_620706 [Coprinopsis marcescibilis]|uniref:RNase III domain-containing protein n=1 Tax=Coprinopsis marcescibilis TaxID=230819 RepID=A0A5C3KST8_COPMA|nr:hypothetical protein FA15DRAFT_620706 [Coprinopsis marcescibilis]